MPGGKIEIDVEPNLQGFDGKIASKLKGLQGPLGSTAKGVGLAVAAGVGLAAVGFKKAIDVGIEYQSSLNDLQAVSHATGEQMARVGDTAKALGSDMSLPATSAADAAAAMTELAKGGLSVDQAMTAAKGTLQLAAAAQIDAASAAQIQSQALNAFGLSADNAGHVADVLANSANAASGEITDFAQAFGQAGAVAHQFGLSIDETSTALGIFANNGILGSDAGTLLKSSLLALANPSKPAAAAIKELGLQVYNAQGKFVGLESLFGQLRTASDKMTDAQYQQATATVFGSDAVRLAGVAANTTGEQWDAMATAIGHAGGASEVAAAKTKGLGGAIEGFKSQLETSAIDLFEVIGPPLESGVRLAADAVSKYGPVVTDGLKSLADAGTAAGKEFGPGIAKSVESGAKEVATSAERLVLPFEQAARNLVDRGIGLVKTAVGGFVDVARDAVDVAEPLAKGAADIATGFTTADGPIGAARVALELAYDAASGVLTIVKPLAQGVGDVAHLFGELPGPVQTAAFALLALKVGPSILSGLKGALSGAGGEAQAASGKLGLFGRAVSGITAPARAVVSATGSAVSTIRQFSDEARVQRAIAEQSGQAIGRMGSAAAAFNSSAIPAVSAARSFAEQTSAIREGAAGAGAPISAMSAAMGTIVERSSALSSARNAFTNAASGAERFGKLAGTAAAGGSLLKNAATGVVGALGGPWGIALAAAGVGLSVLAQRQEEAAQKAADYKKAVDDLTAAYQNSGGVVDESIRQTNNKALADKNVAENAKAAGSSFALYSLAANGNADALDEITKSSDGVIDSIAQNIGLTSDQTASLVGLNDQLLKNGGSFSDVSDKVKLFTTDLDTLSETGGEASSQLSADQLNLVTRIFDANGALGQQVKQNREAQQAFELLAATEANASTETIKLYEAEQKQTQGALSAADATLGYKDAVAQLSEAHQSSSDALSKYGPNSKEYQDALRNEEHGILNVIAAKKKEAEANSTASSDILRQQDGVKAANAEAVRLAGTYKGQLPDALQTYIASLDATSAAAAGLHVSFNDLGEAVYKLPNGKEIKVKADVVAAQSAIDKLPQYAAGVTGTMPVDADVDKATGKVNATVQYADGSVGVMELDANRDPATNQTQIAVQYANGAHGYMTVDAFNQAAKDKTIQVVRFADGSVGVIRVDAATGKANADIDYAARNRTSVITIKTQGGGFTNLPSGYLPAGGHAQMAAGGLLKAYAGGGIEPRPMRGGLADIVPPNTWRIIGDRVRDDEAYIPINRSNRSLSLLEETARRMGFGLLRRYAAGGIASQGGQVPLSVGSLGGPFQIFGSLDIGGALVPLVDARIQLADHESGAALSRGRRT